ncbi:F151B protein, partial [Formicarius rufipectus]|nr:F151B protein [Formicarius rufipectus]
PIMAHPPDTDSDITLQEWLALMVNTDKGIKLDFKSLDAVGPSLELLGQVELHLRRPVWLNGDVAVGPGGSCALPVCHSCLSVPAGFAVSAEPRRAVTGRAGCSPAGYDWAMVRAMRELCRPLSQPVTFPVRAVLVPRSLPELRWLLQQSDRYSLTVWAGKEDIYSVEDLLSIRENFDKSRVYYDIFEPQNSEFKKAIGI